LLAIWILDQILTFQMAIAIVVCSVGLACYSSLQPFLDWLFNAKKNETKIVAEK